MTWIILGDSWSSTDLRTLRQQEFYPFEHSLFNQMRSRYGRTGVVCWATPGASDQEQIDTLSRGVPRQPSKIRVLWGWSDWPRGLSRNAANGPGGPSFHHNDPSWRHDHDLCKRVYTEHFIRHFELNLAHILDCVEFFHWGGQSHIWMDPLLLPGTHHVISRDFAQEHLGAPENTSLSTWITPTVTTRQLWPQTGAKRSRKLDRATLDLKTHRASKPRLYPDGGHPRWTEYRKLLAELPANKRGAF